MGRPPHWKTIESRRIQECRVFDVHRIVARSPRTGRDHDFYGIESPDWVNIVPVTSDGCVAMVHQYRHGSRELTLEIPGGLVDPGEAPEAAAVRELLEETGYRAAEVVSLGSVNPNPALFGNRLHAFLGRDARRVADVVSETTEETVVELVPLRDLRGLIREGVVCHALVVAAVYLADLSGELGVASP